MNQRKGLLAFACTLMVLAAALLQVPIVRGLARIGALMGGESETARSQLAAHLRPPAPASRLIDRTARPVSLADLAGWPQMRQEAERLARSSDLPVLGLLAFWVVAAGETLGPGGMPSVAFPEGEDPGAEDEMVRFRRSAALLARLRQEAGSWEGALVAWKEGPFLARRVAAAAPLDRLSLPRSLNLTLLAPGREETEQFVCAVLSLALLLDEIPIGLASIERTRAVENVPVGFAVVALMPGVVGYAGPDGPAGACVEIRHACNFRSVRCGLQNVRVRPGQVIPPPAAGPTTLGEAATGLVQTEFWVGTEALDPAGVILPQAPRPPAR